MNVLKISAIGEGGDDMSLRSKSISRFIIKQDSLLQFYANENNEDLLVTKALNDVSFKEDFGGNMKLISLRNKVGPLRKYRRRYSGSIRHNYMNILFNNGYINNKKTLKSKSCLS